MPSDSGGDSTQRLAVIGDPIDHSLSPAMQGAALAAAGLPWTYEAMRVAPSELPSAVQRLRETVRGFNITVPHKIAIREHLDEIAPSAQRVDAVNTVVRDGARLIGHNTDLGGFTAALLDLDPGPSGTAVLFGAGGAARAVALALADLGLSLVVVNRSLDRALLLTGAIPGARALSAQDTEVLAQVANAQVIVNATSLGLHAADPSPLPPGARLRPDGVVIDLVYCHHTAFLRTARLCGCRAADGVEMLVRQGAESFRLWTGIEADLEVMRAACRRQLEEARAC